LAVILVIVVGTVRLIGTNANTAFSAVASSLQEQCLACIAFESARMGHCALNANCDQFLHSGQKREFRVS
jgi:hypothetical protein